MYRYVIFDLDGTVLNTLEDLADAGNHALTEFGFPTHPLVSYRRFVGNGIPKMISRMLPPNADEESFNKVYHSFCSYYEEHMNDKTAPYEGIPELLDRLKGRGIKLALISNKAHDYAVDMVRRSFGDVFDVIFGSTEDKPKKPDPYWVLKALEILGAKPGEAFYVGDSSVDMQTAANAGITSCGVLWGFRDKEELLENGAVFICSDTAELENLIVS